MQAEVPGASSDTGSESHTEGQSELVKNEGVAGMKTEKESASKKRSVILLHLVLFLFKFNVG